MAEVVRDQIQKEAVQEAYAHRYEAFRATSVFPNSTAIAGEESTITNVLPVKSSRLHPHRIPMLNLKLKKVTFDQTEPFTSVTENLYYVQLHIGSCICRTHTLNPAPQGFRWDRLTSLEAQGKVPVNDVQLDECIVEILDENPAHPSKAFVGRGHVAIDNTLGYNMGRDVEFTVDIMTREKAILGKMCLTLHADVDEFTSGFVADPKNLNYFEINRKVSNLKKIEMGLLDAMPSVASLEVNAPNSINPEAYSSLSTLVGDLRGDGVEFIKLLTGDVTLSDIQKAGADVSSRITRVSIVYICYLFFNFYNVKQS